MDQQQRHLPYFVVCTERRWIPRARVIKHPVAPHLKENNKKKRALVKKEEEKNEGMNQQKKTTQLEIENLSLL